jgi:hypothetical protein
VSYGVHFISTSDHSFQGFSDADWAGDRDDKSSVGGYCIFHGTNLTSWSCKQQQTVAYSSTESKYKSLSHTAAEKRWLQSILHDLQLPLVTSPKLWCDNIGATYLFFNPISMPELNIVKLILTMLGIKF